MSLAAVMPTWLLHGLNGQPRLGETIVVGLVAIVVTGWAFKQQGLYDLQVLLKPAGHFNRFAAAIIAGGLASATTLALLQDHPGIDETLLLQPLSWGLLGTVGILAARAGFAWRLQTHDRLDRLAQKVGVVGTASYGQAFLSAVSTDPFLRPIGLFSDEVRCGYTSPKSAFRGTVADLLAYARHNPLDVVVIALPPDAPERVAAVRKSLSGLAATVMLANGAAGPALPANRLTTLGGQPVLSLGNFPLQDWAGFQKALFDRVVGAILLILATPLMSVLALSIKATSPGPVLFRQTREGLNGIPFVMLKFRSMVHDEAADQSRQATRCDPRVTRLGGWLRRTSLDELPQLMNVVRGDMSLVGPRPHLASTRAGKRLFHDVVPDYAARHRVKPGLTGWAQVQGLRGETRTEQQITDRVAHDLYYIEHWSFGFDLHILVRTLVQELWGDNDNAY